MFEICIGLIFYDETGPFSLRWLLSEGGLPFEKTRIEFLEVRRGVGFKDWIHRTGRQPHAQNAIS